MKTTDRNTNRSVAVCGEIDGNGYDVVFHNIRERAIEKIDELPRGVLLETEGLTHDNSTSVISISVLYVFVKTYDKDYHAGKEVSPLFLNEKVTPKIFYHGAKKNGGFTSFRDDLHVNTMMSTPMAADDVSSLHSEMMLRHFVPQ